MLRTLPFPFAFATLSVSLALGTSVFVSDARAQAAEDGALVTTGPIAPPTLVLASPALDASRGTDATYARRLRHARRLEVAGWTIFVMGGATLLIGAPLMRRAERESTKACLASGSDSWCGFLEGIATIAVVMFALPVTIVGAAVGGRGTALRRRLQQTTLTFVPTASPTAWGLTLRGAF